MRNAAGTTKPIFRISVLCGFFFALLLSVQCAFAETPIPDTPAGQVLKAWFEAFNSGDRAKIDAYIKTYDPKQAPDMMSNFHSRTGGFDLLSIDSSQPLLIKFRVKEKASPTMAIGSLQLKQAQPPIVESLGLRAIPPGAVVEDIKLDAPARQKVIDDVAASLQEYYVYPDVAAKMEQVIRDRQKHGDYDAITGGSAFADMLTVDLLEVSHDKHLHVIYNPFESPADHPGDEPTPEEKARYQKDMERDNCGFEKVEILPGNIGYLKFNMFADADVCGATAAAAMGFLAHVDAIIFDMRENGGGDPKMVALMCSYLFDKPTHLNDLYDRKEDSTTQYWTLSYLPGTRLPTQPVFVLTSHRTFSGAEEFTNDLKTQQRATIIGETTGGGAHPVSGHPIGDHFMIGVPFARAVNPITKTDWEGTGVEPDVKVSADAALDEAKKEAAGKLQSDAGKPPSKIEIRP